jgi:hypothetical protein
MYTELHRSARGCPSAKFFPVEDNGSNTQKDMKLLSGNRNALSGNNLFCDQWEILFLYRPRLLGRTSASASMAIFLKRPDGIGNAGGHRGRDSQSLVDPGKVKLSFVFLKRSRRSSSVRSSIFPRVHIL